MPIGCDNLIIVPVNMGSELNCVQWGEAYKILGVSRAKVLNFKHKINV